MKKCLKCGNTITDNSDFFCSNCGGALVESEEDVCKNCGAVIDPRFEFCTKCHAKINTFSSAYAPTKHRKGFSEKLLAPFISAAIVACILAIAVVCGLFFMSGSGDKVPQSSPGAALIPHEKPLTDESTEEQEESSDTDEEKEVVYEEPQKTNQVLYDYDSSSDDWYRLRKAENGGYTQAGAYKTVKSALYYANIYVPQGYALYDKDFNIVDIENYTVIDAPRYDYYSPEEYLYDYDSDNDDYYRIRMFRNDASSQVGAYKTVKSALYYADIYCPQGYTLYDKDFNVIR